MKRFRRCLRMDRCPTDMNRADWDKEGMQEQIRKLRIRYRAASASSLAHAGPVSQHEAQLKEWKKKKIRITDDMV